jgi:hypothetical protein
MGGWPFRGAARWTCQIRPEPADQAGPCPFALLIIKKLKTASIVQQRAVILSETAELAHEIASLMVQDTYCICLQGSERIRRDHGQRTSHQHGVRISPGVARPPTSSTPSP